MFKPACLLLPVIRVWILCLLALSRISAHQVDTVEFEFQRLDGTWRLHGEMDLAYMLPETRWVPDGQPLSRSKVMKAPPQELARIRRETENTLRQYLSFTYGGKPLPWRIEFPDFDKKPFTLPEEYKDWALMTVRLVVDQPKTPGEFVVHWSKEERATLIILTEDSPDGEIVSVEPGDSLTLLKVKVKAGAPPTTAKQVETGEGEAAPELVVEMAEVRSFQSWIWNGFRHVLPKGVDHMLFIFGLFVAVVAFKPMLWQSLLFTLSHSLTLAVCALGWVTLEGRWVEIFIAFSIAFIGVEDLLGVKVGKRRYITVFVFGLVHGLGFASVLAEQVKGIPHSQLVKPLLGFNLGVELAQITVILAAALLFSILGKKRRKAGQKVGALIVTLAGVAWMVERIFGLGLIDRLLS